MPLLAAPANSIGAITSKAYDLFLNLLVMRKRLIAQIRVLRARILKATTTAKKAVLDGELFATLQLKLSEAPRGLTIAVLFKETICVLEGLPTSTS